jgi:hypothetical protein
MEGDKEMTSSGDNQGSSGIAPAPQGFWAPDTHNYVAGSAHDLEQRLKKAGIKLRKELLVSAHNDLDSWLLLFSPPFIHETSHTLVEMVLNKKNIPAKDRDHFTPFGESSVCIPLRMLEKYMYPVPYHQAHATLWKGKIIILLHLSAFQGVLLPLRLALRAV